MRHRCELSKGLQLLHVSTMGSNAKKTHGNEAADGTYTSKKASVYHIGHDDIDFRISPE